MNEMKTKDNVFSGNKQFRTSVIFHIRLKQMHFAQRKIGHETYKKYLF
jgi:hypothetical protein